MMKKGLILQINDSLACVALIDEIDEIYAEIPKYLTNVKIGQIYLIEEKEDNYTLYKEVIKDATNTKRNYKRCDIKK